MALEYLVVYDDFSEAYFSSLLDEFNEMKAIFWAWEWTGIDPDNKNIQYTFVFMRDGTGNYTMYKNGKKSGNPIKFNWDENYITLESGKGKNKKYALSSVGSSVDDLIIILNNWNDSGKKLNLNSDYKD